MTAGAIRRVLLVGFMGSGKSTVGRRVAEALGWDFEDADAALVASFGMPIARVFDVHGEAEFRLRERSAMCDLLARDHVVIAAGGGWAADPAWIESVDAATASVWLTVGVGEALARVAGEPGVRPLLDLPDPSEKARELLDARESAYALAQWKVDTEARSVEDVSARILEIVSGTST